MAGSTGVSGTGWISNLRYNNTTAVYTGNFTPSTSPLTAVANTSVLTCQSYNFLDNSTNAFTITKNGSTQISSLIPFIPGSSYATYGSTYFNGSTDWSSVASNAAFTLSADFTIEGWAYTTSLNNIGIFRF